MHSRFPNLQSSKFQELQFCTPDSRTPDLYSRALQNFKIPELQILESQHVEFSVSRAPQIWSSGVQIWSFERAPTLQGKAGLHRMARPADLRTLRLTVVLGVLVVSVAIPFFVGSDWGGSSLSDLRSGMSMGYGGRDFSSTRTGMASWLVQGAPDQAALFAHHGHGYTALVIAAAHLMWGCKVGCDDAMRGYSKLTTRGGKLEMRSLSFETLCWTYARFVGLTFSPENAASLCIQRS